jgi:radical SAM superfamily enzyme YgiQ (UPF0313 family)
MKLKLIAFNGRYIHSCLALFYVREELKKNLPEAEVDLHQFTINDPYYETMLQISAGNPRAVFFSVYIWNGDLVLKLLNDLARTMPQTFFILGGPQAAAFRKSDLPERCVVVDGEVEGLATDFYMDLEDGRLKSAYQCAPGQPFPSPYNDEDLKGELRNRHIYYESIRGCPFNCSYCLSSVERGVTWKELETVKEELGQILKHKPKIIKFVDRTFNANPQRAMEIWHFLAARPESTVFHFEMAPDLFSEEMFEFLAELSPGLFQFELGIQSTNPKTLETVNRVMALDKVQTNMGRLAQLNNIHLHADLILGLPEETENSFRQAINDVFSMAPHYIQMGLLKVLPTTRISKTPGLSHCQKAPYQVLATADMDQQTIAHYYWLGECLEAFHNNRYFPSLFKYLRDQKEDICLFLEKLLDTCNINNFFSLSPTQQLLNDLLSKTVSDRPDSALIHELLRYDWFRCGHHFLPDCIKPEGQKELAKKLHREMPQNLPPFYDYRNRDEFFRKSTFLQLSAPTIKQLGLSEDDREGVVCFSPEPEQGVHSFQKVCLLP